MAKTIQQQLQVRIVGRSWRATPKLASVTALCITGALTLGLIVYALRPRQAATPTETTVSAALNLRQVLAQQLHLHPASVQIARVEGRTWSDACLEAPYADELCTEVQTPGYRIMLAAAGSRYIYHTDSEGNHHRLVSAPEPSIGKPVLTWSRVDGSGRHTLEIGAEGVAFGRCGGLLLGAPFSLDTRQADLDEFAAKYASFEAETPMGTLRFVGSGPTIATPDEESMIAEWARSVYLESVGGRSGASWGLAPAWHRDGGLTGLYGMTLASGSSTPKPGHRPVSRCPDTLPGGPGPSQTGAGGSSVGERRPNHEGGRDGRSPRQWARSTDRIRTVSAGS